VATIAVTTVEKDSDSVFPGAMLSVSITADTTRGCGGNCREGCWCI